MCTVTVVPYAGGFRLMSNRDERRDRSMALQPRLERLGPRTTIMPIDPVAGGSWIGVNDSGLAATLLNRYGVQRVQSGGSLTQFASRGLIVRRVLAADSIAAALESIRTLDATLFQPFRLVLVHGDRIALACGDGQQIESAESVLARPFMFTASSLGDVFVDEPRRRLFEFLMDHAEDSSAGQLLFHRHQWHNKRDISVVMDRDDAATVSRTAVEVAGRQAVLEYESLVPPRPAQRFELQAC